MKPPQFEYYAPASLQEAVGLLGHLGPDAKVLAGGQSLVPVLNMRLARPEALIDLTGLRELDYIRPVAGGLEVGALTTHRTVERSAEAAAHAPLLAEAMPLIAHLQIRNRGTIGGSLVHNDPSAELPAVLAALDGAVTLCGPAGRRTLPWHDFFLGLLTTATRPDEILTSVFFPALPPGSRTAIMEVARRHGDFALAGAAVTLTPAPVAPTPTPAPGSRVAGGRVALFGVGGGPVRVSGAEALLREAEPGPELWAAVARAAVADLDPPGDLHALPEYRREAAEALVQRALAAAWARSDGGASV